MDRHLSSSVMVEAAYVATKGSHIFRNLDLNVPFPGPGPVPPRRPFFNIAPNIPSINQQNGDGASSYLLRARRTLAMAQAPVTADIN